MSEADPHHVAGALLAEQRAYYRALASEYAEHALEEPGGEELERALDRFAPAGDVLELACGPATWTPALLRHASSVTALDAAPEMLRIAAARVGDARVKFVCADLFDWTPDRRYDAVFFGFWLSHVPTQRFARFWELVDRALRPCGRVFFVDDGHRTAEELARGRYSELIQRRLNDGSAYEIVKVALEPADLERRLRAIGWDITVQPTTGPFFWGAGGRVL